MTRRLYITKTVGASREGSGINLTLSTDVARVCNNSGVSDPLEQLMRRLDRLEAEQDLHRLAHDYCIGADHRDTARWAAVWTEDASWITGPDHAFHGIEQICRAVEAQWRAFPLMQHATANHVVEIDGDHATGRADVVVFVQRSDGGWITGGGTYEDVYQRHDGRWRIARRTVIRPFDLPLPGKGSRD